MYVYTFVNECKQNSGLTKQDYIFNHIQVFSKVGSEISISSLNYIKVTGPEKWTKLAQNTPNHKMLNIMLSMYSILCKNTRVEKVLPIQVK